MVLKSQSQKIFRMLLVLFSSMTLIIAGRWIKQYCLSISYPIIQNIAILGDIFFWIGIAFAGYFVFIIIPTKHKEIDTSKKKTIDNFVQKEDWEDWTF